MVDRMIEHTTTYRIVMAIISNQDTRADIASIDDRDGKAEGSQAPQRDWLEELFAIADRAPWSSDGKKWSREDLYDA